MSWIIQPDKLWYNEGKSWTIKGKPFKITKQPDKLRYNEGSSIRSRATPVFDLDDETGIPITPDHAPCGYWFNRKASGPYRLPRFLDEDVIVSGPTIITVEDGEGPYSWVTVGNGSVQESVTEDGQNIVEVICGTLEITVYDAYGAHTTTYYSSTVGNWTYTTYTGCVLAGEADTWYYPGWGGLRLTKISGRYKQTQEQVSNTIYTGYYWECDYSGANSPCNAWEASKQDLCIWHDAHLTASYCNCCFVCPGSEVCDTCKDRGDTPKYSVWVC